MRGAETRDLNASGRPGGARWPTVTPSRAERVGRIVLGLAAVGAGAV